MDKFSRYMQNYLLYGLPFALALIIWSPFYYSHPIAKRNTLTWILYELMSYNLMCWFLMIVLYMVFLVVIPSVRDRTLSRLANLQERDEREAYITGKAARASYIATLSLTLFFLFFSSISVYYTKLPETNPQKPKHSIGINLHYTFFNQADNKKAPAENEQIIFDSNDYAPSNSTMLILLLAWQLLTFNLAARREGIKNLE